MDNEKITKKTLELFAEELPEQVDISIATAGVSTASSTTTASCPASTYSTFATASSY